MALWRFKRGVKEPGDTGRVEKEKKVIKRSVLRPLGQGIRVSESLPS